MHETLGCWSHISELFLLCFQRNWQMEDMLSSIPQPEEKKKKESLLKQIQATFYQLDQIGFKQLHWCDVS